MIAHRNNDTGGAACSRWPSRLTQANAAATDKRAKAYLETAEDRGHTVLHLDGKCLGPPRQSHSQVKLQGFITPAGGVEQLRHSRSNFDELGRRALSTSQGAGRRKLARPA